MRDSVELFGVSVSNQTLEEAVNKIVQALGGETCVSVHFLNAHGVNLSRSDPDYFEILQQSDWVFGDGIGMRIASQFLGKPLCDNVNGTDLFPLLCNRLEADGRRVFFLGGAPGIAERLRETLQIHYPSLQIAGTRDGFFPPEETERVIQSIRNARADLLMVAMGNPLQEKWIARYAASTGVRVAMGVGGLFNFYSGAIPRAPRWMRRCGLEWLHRLWREPSRLWRRYLIGNMRFLCLTAWEALRPRQQSRRIMP